MNTVKSLKILFVVNLVSGSKSKIDYRAIISSYFQALPHSIDFFFLTGKDDIESLKEIIQRIKPERVIAVG
ncbi:MAG: hypothetical protein LH473_04765, partial [Chitinophagales bacterium]|nr:hypothetical protein [Chitinophagales bacterium]